MDLKDKIVVVTGAGSGIGRALSRRFAQEGGRVLLTGRRLERLEHVRKEIQNAGGQADCYPLDVTEETKVAEFFKKVDQEYGGSHVLFNNAGSFQSIGGIWEVDPHQWWSDVTANLRGPMLMMRYALPAMMRNCEGLVINMNGGGSTAPLAGGSGYGSSKAALLRLTETAARELERVKSPIGVVAIAPGLVVTEMTEIQMHTEMGRQWLPGTADAFAAGETRPPDDCANSTIELVRNYISEFSGRVFDTGADFVNLRDRLSKGGSSNLGLMRLADSF